MAQPQKFAGSLNPDRKPFLAFHDSTAVYAVTAVFTLGVFLFSLSGLQAAWASPVYLSYAWVPILLMVLSICLLIPCCVRLFRRLVFSLQERFEGGDGFLL